MILKKQKTTLYLSIMVCVVCFSFPIRAKPAYVHTEDVMEYPYILSFKYNFGVCNDVFQIHRIGDTVDGNGSFKYGAKMQNLNVHLYELSVDWVQISRGLYKMMNGYPKLGFDFGYHHFENKGKIFSGLVHVIFQTDYLKFFEIVPKIGLGIAYLNLPLTFKRNIIRAKKNVDGKIEYDAEEEPHHEVHHGYFRSGMSPKLDISIDFEFRLYENWLVKPGVGFIYIPDYSWLFDNKQVDNITGNASKDTPTRLRRLHLYDKDTDVIIYSAGISLGYIVNPNRTSYDDLMTEQNRTYTKILLSYGRRKYDRVAEYIWESALEGLSKMASPSLGQGETALDGDYSKINSSDLDSYIASTRAKYNVFGINLQWANRIGSSHSFVLMTEIIADLTNKKIMDNVGLVRNSSLKFSIGFGHDFIYKDFTFGKQVGFYILNSVYSIKLSSFLRDIAFLRLNLDYKIENHWVVGLAVRNRLELLYNDADLNIGNFELSMKRFYKFDIKVDYPEVYIGYSL